MTRQADLSPWMARLDPDTREAVRRNVAQAPPLTPRQRERIRLLFRTDPTPDTKRRNKTQ